MKDFHCGSTFGSVQSSGRDEPSSNGGGGQEAEEVAWRTAVDAAPWLLGESPKRSVPPERFFEKLKPFKELVAEDIRDSEDEGPGD